MTPEQFEALCEGHQRFNGSGKQERQPGKRSMLDLLQSKGR